MDDTKNKLLMKSLQCSRIFGDLGEDLIKDIADVVKLHVVHGSDMVFKQGKPSDSMIVVVSGRLLATFTDEEGNQKQLAEISPGSTAGELGLILRQPRSASVLAVRDSCIGILTRQCFDNLLAKYPGEINRAITRTVFEYNTLLNKKSRIVSATIITFVNMGNTADSEARCRSLCEMVCSAVGAFATVKHLNQVTGEAALLSDADFNHASIRINELEQQFDYLIFEINNDGSDWSQLATRQSDQIIAVQEVNTDSRGQPLLLARELRQSSMFQQLRKSMVLLHPSESSQPLDSSHWPESADFKLVHCLRENNTEDINRLTRHLSDRTVALVLGGGGARGMAHVGVLRALQDARIPVDYVCGNSMGALIGAQYVYRKSTDDLIHKTQEFIKGGERLSFPFVSILAGSRIKRDLKKMFGNAQVECLWQQFYTVSCNLSKAEVYVHDKGPLWQAVLASNSPAGIMPPVVKDGNLLVDAALLDNVPVESMRQRLRYGTLIAVDVDVSDEMSVSPELTQLSPLNHLKQLFFNSDDSSKKQPGILELLNRAGHLGGLARRKQAKNMADYYLQPPVASFGLMSYGRGEEIAATAYQYTRNQILNWPEFSFYQADDK